MRLGTLIIILETVSFLLITLDLYGEARLRRANRRVDSILRRLAAVGAAERARDWIALTVGDRHRALLWVLSTLLVVLSATSLLQMFRFLRLPFASAVLTGVNVVLLLVTLLRWVAVPNAIPRPVFVAGVVLFPGLLIVLIWTAVAAGEVPQLAVGIVAAVVTPVLLLLIMLIVLLAISVVDGLLLRLFTRLHLAGFMLGIGVPLFIAAQWLKYLAQ